MESKPDDYHISFFRPTTDSARRNRNMVVQLILVWAIAIFGFQILLKILEKPTPEEAWIIYDSVRDDIESGSTDPLVLKQASRSALSILGKVSIDPVHRDALDNLISWSAYNIADSAQKKTLVEKLQKFERLKTAEVDLRSFNYKSSKDDMLPLLQEIYGLAPHDVRSRIASVHINSGLMQNMSRKNISIVHEAMDLYLVHNRSVLTDIKFLGFPFHYFYTAVFLLILFVGLCWVYCVRTDMFNKKYEIAD
ncbi:MAG: DUF4212 domain-containing protein [Bacteroidales bacterium]|nr:DUF4212 domain-containing protein [Bacteroidales bacterium]